MGNNPHWFAQWRARGLCYVCRRAMDDADPRPAHAACLRLLSRGWRTAAIRAADGAPVMSAARSAMRRKLAPPGVTDTASAPPATAAALGDPAELARLHREQPPAPIPRRTYTAPVPGLVALAVLGGRVVRRCD